MRKAGRNIRNACKTEPRVLVVMKPTRMEIMGLVK